MLPGKLRSVNADESTLLRRLHLPRLASRHLVRRNEIIELEQLACVFAEDVALGLLVQERQIVDRAGQVHVPVWIKIGRASCRERV